MNRNTGNNGHGLSMRQTLAIGLLAGLSAAVVHALTCNRNLTEDEGSGPGALPPFDLGQASAPGSSTVHYALYFEPAPNSNSTEPYAPAGPDKSQSPAMLIQRGPALLWRL